MTKPFKWLEGHYGYEEVMERMSEVDPKYWNLYSTGLKGLDYWYGDKSYREYDDWLDIFDKMVKEIDNA